MSQIQSTAKDVLDFKRLLGAVILFLCIPSLFSLPYLFYTFFRKRSGNKTDYVIFIVCISIFFAAINATKSVGGDQWRYWMAYNNVPIKGFLYALMNIYGTPEAWQGINHHISGEFMNGVYNYIGYYLSFGYYPLFVFLFTLTSYILLLLGYYRFCLTLKSPHIPIICGILIISFFYLYFQFTLQIQKQFFAQAIMMYVIGNYAYYGRLRRKDWFAVACSVFTHQSMLFFVPFILLKRFRSKMGKGTIAFVFIILAFLVFWGPSLMGGVDFSNGSALSYGLERFANSETNNDGLSIQMNQVVVIGLPLAVICFRQLQLNRNYVVPSQQFIVIVVSLILVTTAAMVRQPLAQYRFFMMLMPFMPFIYSMTYRNIQKRNIFLMILAVAMVVWFFFQFEYIYWTYAPEIDILIKSPIFLVFSNYQGF